MVPFPRKFRGTGDEMSGKELDARLSAATELSGVLNKALAALRRLNTCGFTVSESIAQAGREFREATDPLAIWHGPMTIDGSAMYVPKDVLVRLYNADAERAGRPAMTAKGSPRRSCGFVRQCTRHSAWWEAKCAECGSESSFGRSRRAAMQRDRRSAASFEVLNSNGAFPNGSSVFPNARMTHRIHRFSPLLFFFFLPNACTRLCERERRRKAT
jgi:hypothetical protein